MKLYPTCHVPRSMGGCDRSPEQGALLCDTHREALCMRLMDATLAAARFCHPMSLFTTLYASALRPQDVWTVLWEPVDSDRPAFRALLARLGDAELLLARAGLENLGRWHPDIALRIDGAPRRRVSA